MASISNDAYFNSFSLENSTELSRVQIERIARGVSYAVVGLVAIIGNFLVIFMVVLSRKLHTITNIFIVNLSIADLFIGLVFPFQSLWILKLDIIALPDWGCTAIGTLVLISVGCSVSTLFFIAMNRYVLITRSRVAYQRVFTPFNIVLMIASTWLNLTGFLIVPQLVGFGRLGYDPYLELCVWDPTYVHDKWYKSAALALLTLPLVFSSMFYSLIFRFIRNHFKSLAAHRQPNASPIAPNRRIDIVITKNLLLVICTFYICIMPFVVSFCATGFGATHPEVFGYAASYLAILLGLNSCLNPIFYCLKHPHFREVFKCIVRCQMARIPLPSALLRKALPAPDRRSVIADMSSLNNRTDTNNIS